MLFGNLLKHTSIKEIHISRGISTVNNLCRVLGGKPWLSLWYYVFAKLSVYLTSAVNPILYNLFSVKFRRAFKRVLRCGNWRLICPAYLEENHQQSLTATNFSLLISPAVFSYPLEQVKKLSVARDTNLNNLNNDFLPL